MKTIPLTRGQVALVDDEDFEGLSAHKWNAWKGKYTWYATRTITVRSPKIRRDIKMHREILGLQFGDPRQGDHIDGNGLNNQRHNLRSCTKMQNMRNQRVRISSKFSKYKGVRKSHHQNVPYMSQIRINSIGYTIGYFRTEEAAALAYNEVAKVHFGEFARLNVFE